MSVVMSKIFNKTNILFYILEVAIGGYEGLLFPCFHLVLLLIFLLNKTLVYFWHGTCCWFM